MSVEKTTAPGATSHRGTEGHSSSPKTSEESVVGFDPRCNRRHDRRSEPRPTARERGILARGYAKLIRDERGQIEPGRRITLSVHDCGRHVGIQLFAFTRMVEIAERDERAVVLSNGMVIPAAAVDGLMERAGIQQEVVA